MVLSSCQQISTLLSKHVLNYKRNKTYIKEIIAMLIVGAICMLLNNGGGSGLQNIPMYMPLAIMLFCRGSVLTWVSQKTTKHAQIQTIMGASYTQYLLSWMAFFMLNGLYLSIIFITFLSIIGVFSQLDLGELIKILLLYFLLMVAVLNFCLMISSFFSDAQVAAQVITFLQLLGVGFFFLLQINDFRQSQLALTGISLIPSVCFQITSLFINQKTNPFGDLPFTQTQGYVMLFCQSIVYFILFIYFEKIIPNANGTHLHPFFFLKTKKQQNRREGSSLQLYQRFQVDQIASSARFYQQQPNKNNITCYIKNLQKKFGDKKVVNNLSLTLNKKQIFCLLGHNGAGKSTTINMLTGILKPDKGKMNIFGYDFQTQLPQIRKKIGVCLQTDVLYDRLTVKEHLQFFGKLKGFFNQELNRKIQEIIAKSCLQTEINKQASTLSGGNKRKLCLACAAIGDSQLIFLDEPSSGMDPNTRRKIWGMIQQLREEGKTIVLTTHHLQQAQYLSNRIGILANGQLIILGSCHYIKQKFGIGYHLKITLGDNQQQKNQLRKKQIRVILQKIIGQYKQDEQVAKNQMKILLPKQSQDKYSNLFHQLEQSQIQFSLVNSSLEDIFIKIGQDPESVLNNQPLPEIQKLEMPRFVPSFSFFNQSIAVFIKKSQTVLRSFSVFVSLILPIIYITLGAIVALIIPVYQGQQRYIMIWTKFYILAYFMTIAYSFNTSSFCGSIVDQRQRKFKYLSFVMGMREFSYWFGTLMFDMILFWIPSIIVFIMIYCFPSEQSDVFISKTGYLFILFLAFSLSFLPFTYLWTHAFQKAQTAYRFFPFFVMLFFAILPQIPIYTAPKNQILHLIISILSPLSNLVNGMLSWQIVGQDAYDYFDRQRMRVYTPPSLWGTIGLLLIQGIFYFTLTLILDNIKFRLNDRQHLSVQQMKNQRSEDQIKQQKKINQIGSRAPIIVDSLYKKYPNGYLAIKDNSFIVEEGQTFGLLGPNGAGKSTTFNILTAAEPKTHGTVKLLNQNVKRSAKHIFQEVGVCPQFNPIYDNMTVTEHLRFFSRLKGQSGAQMEESIEFYIKNVQLAQYRNQKAGTLSGGNKRKLCVCISLIGNPSLLFLDQPSAGVDAISRRYLWNILQSSTRQSNKSIILTTHSIHEAQSLCKRIGILIKGQFICIGTPTQLKKRYGKGFRINVRCQSEQNILIVKQQMSKNYKQYEIQQNKEDMKLSFLVSRQNFKFSQAFDLFYNKLYQKKIIKQYEIAQNSLQDVFINLSKMQPQPEGQVFKPVHNFCCWERSQRGCKCIF